MEGIVGWYAWVPRLINCSDIIPICPKFNLHWRDSVMLIGLVTTIAGIAVAIFQGVFFLAAAFFLSTAIICFGGYYVSRYAELTEMREQLDQLQRTNIDLSETANQLRADVRTFQEQNERLSSEFASFRNSNTLLAQAHEQLNHQLQTLASISTQIDERQISLRTIIAEEGRIQGLLSSETGRLASIREELSTLVTQFQTIRNDLQISTQTLSQAQTLQEAIRHIQLLLESNPLPR